MYTHLYTAAVRDDCALQLFVFAHILLLLDLRGVLEQSPSVLSERGMSRNSTQQTTGRSVSDGRRRPEGPPGPGVVAAGEQSLQSDRDTVIVVQH